jgi:hypothetical protein
MTQSVLHPIIALIVVFASGVQLGALGVHLVGCAPPTQAPVALPAYCYDRQAYVDAQKACSKAASSRVESDACGDELDRVCGLLPVKR